MEWLAKQLTAVAGRSVLNLECPKYNPRPPGTIREGSTTQAVLVFLNAHPRRFFTHREIVAQTGRTAKSVDFALLYLHAIGFIERTPDPTRNSRYLRYRIF